MPITFDCEGCGKFYTVPDELAGRTARCKQCGTSMVIPKPAKKSRPAAPPPDEEEELVGAEVIGDDEPAPTPPKKLRPDRPPPKKVVQAGEEIVGAEVIEDDEPAPAAPRKKSPAAAPTEEDANPFAFMGEEPARKARRPAPRPEAEADGEEEESPPSKSRKSAAPVEAEDEEEAPPPPRKRRKKVRKSSALVWIIGGLAAGLLLLSVAGAAVYFLVVGSSGSVDDDARFFPDNCAVFASVRMKDLCDSTAFKEVEQIAPGSNRMQFETEFGMPPEAIRQLVVAIAVQDKDAPVMILHANRDISADGFKSKLRGNFDQMAVGSYTIYQNPSKAFCLIDSRTVVLAPPAVLQAILKRDKKAALSPGLQEGLQSVSLSRTAVIVADLKATRKPGSGGLMDIPLADKFVDPVEVLAIQVDVGSDVNLEATAICRDATAADDARKLIEGGLVAAKSQPGLPTELAEILGAVKVSTSGKKLTGNLRFKPSRLTKGFLPGQPNPQGIRPKK
jgi:hypothetical protein